MHWLTEIDIRNYKSCRDCRVPLASFTPLVGYNNGGKTNILRAICWLLRKSALPREDFFNATEPVEISGTIEGLADEALERLDPKHRKRIEPFCPNGRLMIRRVQSEPSNSLKAVSLELRSVDDAWQPTPTGIDAAISALFPEPIFIEAMEDAADDVARHKSTSTIGKLVSEITKPLEELHGETIGQALGKLREILEADGENRSPELEDFDRGANELVQELFPGVRIALHLPPPGLGDLFKASTIRVFEGHNTVGREIGAMGHGAQRSIQMALVRYLAEVKARSQEGGARTLLMIDEPELYLHPQATVTVAAALRNLSNSGYQVLVATHSPQVVEQTDISDTLIIRKRSGQTTVAPTLRDAVAQAFEDAPSQTRTLFDFSRASQVLFSDKVLIAEGKAELRLLPSVFRELRSRSLGEARIGLVEVGGSTSIPKSLEILRAMGIPARALVDLDFAFRHGVKAGLIDMDAEEIATCKEIFEDIAVDHKIKLGPDGLPTKNGIRAEEAFAVLASDPRATPAIRQLHDQLLEQDIWLWTHGSLEHHLGLGGKGEAAWADFVEQLCEDGADAIADAEGVRGALLWIEDAQLQLT